VALHSRYHLQTIIDSDELGAVAKVIYASRGFHRVGSRIAFLCVMLGAPPMDFDVAVAFDVQHHAAHYFIIAVVADSNHPVAYRYYPSIFIVHNDYLFVVTVTAAGGPVGGLASRRQYGPSTTGW